MINKPSIRPNFKDDDFNYNSTIKKALQIQNYLKERQEEIKQDTDNTFKMTYNECFNQLNEMINSTYIQNGDKIKAIDTFLKHYENIERLKKPLTNYED